MDHLGRKAFLKPRRYPSYPLVDRKECVTLGPGYQEVIDERIKCRWIGTTYRCEMDAVIRAYNASVRAGLICC